ncbi:hypothetical protein RF11_08596 [Thelohanellus kitauei]|uniref:Uncharacterized protein n=1 Tax=Thelohanellus kitauei TaxID=669202 RepID=A0A0C2IX95_THEKT|nr:hypothetical protein RF11_08596 [Thelohanellus kitauei]
MRDNKDDKFASLCKKDIAAFVSHFYVFAIHFPFFGPNFPFAVSKYNLNRKSRQFDLQIRQVFCLLKFKNSWFKSNNFKQVRFSSLHSVTRHFVEPPCRQFVPEPDQVIF